MKVLITGGNGQLAKELVATARADWKLISLSRQQLDIADETQCRQILAESKPDVIINTAAYNQVDQAETDSERAHAVNTLGPQNLANYATSNDVRFLHVSTDYVFSGEQSHPYLTDATPAPLNSYGETKFLGELAVLNASSAHIVMRTAWVYSHYDNNFVTNFLNWLQQKPEFNIVCDQIGTPTWARNLALAIWQAICKPDVNGILHITDAGVASRYDFVCAIQEQALRLGLLTHKAELNPVNASDFVTAAKRPYYSVLDKMSSWQKLSIKPQHWQQALLQMLHLLKSEPNAISV